MHKRIQVTEMVWNFINPKRIELRAILPGPHNFPYYFEKVMAEMLPRPYNFPYFEKVTVRMRSDEALVSLTVELLNEEGFPWPVHSLIQDALGSLSQDCNFHALGPYERYPNKHITTLIFKKRRPASNCLFAMNCFIRTVSVFRKNLPVFAGSLPIPEITQRTLVDIGNNKILSFGEWIVERYICDERTNWKD